MEMTGERILPAPRQAVWAALNDPGVLRASIPGCKSLELAGENAFRAQAAVKIGPIAANFTGEVTLKDIIPPTSYRIEGAGQGGQAGFARGGASVSLSDTEGGTKLSYQVQAEVGGKIAQLGARLIDASAKQMAGQFFDNFAAALAASEAARAAAPGEPPPALPQAAPELSLLSLIPREIGGYPLFAWAGLAVLLAFGLLLLSAFF